MKKHIMLQNILRKLLSNKQSRSVVDINLHPDISLKKWRSYQMIHRTKDDDEIILRKNKTESKSASDSNHRKRIVSCPDATDLQLMYKTMDIALVDLKRICEEGEQVLQDDEESVFSSDTEDIFLIETDKEDEGKPNENGSDDVNGSTTTLEARR